MGMIVLAALIAFGYFLGAIPFGYLIAKKYYRIDIRKHGSGNTGATNVWRVLGKKPGLATLALDITKGFLPVLLARLLLPGEYGTALFCGAAAVIGHNWSVYLKGSGGKGVATSAGVFLALLPKHTLLAIAVFLIVFAASRRVSVGSIVAALALMGTTFILHTPDLYRILVIVIGGIILIKHIPNMKRLAVGKEPAVQIIKKGK
ncbi:MAG: glycerol-3-phosphate 1-O-acyltransferase PlsY [Elusimicrobia bacterium]|nr:glycerol-3-phosphate 1-O-acyltransferase PlsY [Candidatus Obscuribacterium magneticum]